MLLTCGAPLSPPHHLCLPCPQALAVPQLQCGQPWAPEPHCSYAWPHAGHSRVRGGRGGVNLLPSRPGVQGWCACGLGGGTTSKGAAGSGRGWPVGAPVALARGSRGPRGRERQPCSLQAAAGGWGGGERAASGLWAAAGRWDLARCTSLPSVAMRLGPPHAPPPCTWSGAWGGLGGASAARLAALLSRRLHAVARGSIACGALRDQHPTPLALPPPPPPTRSRASSQVIAAAAQGAGGMCDMR